MRPFQPTVVRGLSSSATEHVNSLDVGSLFKVDPHDDQQVLLGLFGVGK